MSDRHLVIRAQAGDQTAFTALVTAYRQMVFSTCYRVAGRVEDAEDLAHEAFVEAFLKLYQLRDPERFAGWLRALALNLCRMWLRGQKLEETALLAELPAEEARDGALEARLAHGLAHLSPAHRLAVVLHHLEGLSYEEVATFLDVPIGTVMSRLHRGRKELRRLLEAMEDEEIVMKPDEGFTHEVDAEIAVLLAMFREEPGAAERLSVLLCHSPERLAALIAESEDEETLANLARLLPRLGRPAIEIALNCALTGEETTRRHATSVLRRLFTHIRQGTQGGPAWERMSPIAAYYLLDGLMRSTAADRAKTDLLVALLEACEDEQTATLLSNVLMCCPKAAQESLLAWFYSRRDADEVWQAARMVAALGRLGTRFVAAILPMLCSSDLAQRSKALVAMEGFARSRFARLGDRGDARHALRFYEKWAPIPPVWLDASVIAEATRRTAASLDVGDVAVRNRAIKVLGLLHAETCRQRLEDLAEHADDASTRVAALRALTEIGGTASARVFLQAAAHAAALNERQAATEAIGRLHLAEALPTLLHLVDDGESRVRQVAVVALGDIGGEEAGQALRRLARSDDRAVARAAAKVLTTSPHFRPQHQANEKLLALHRVSRERRLGENPRPQAFISLSEGIAALPEIGRYGEREVTRYLARGVWDYSTTRRQLIMDKLMTRDQGVYELTDAGKAIWRVERCIRQRYMALM